jgi:hypothetical protein
MNNMEKQKNNIMKMRMSRENGIMAFLDMNFMELLIW